MERVLLHKNETLGGLPRIERITDSSLVFCACVEDVSETRGIVNPIAIVRDGCDLCDGRGVVTDEVAAMFIGALLELEAVIS